MVGARFLQPALHVVVQARPIADDDRRDDRARLRTPAADAVGNRAARICARSRHRLGEPTGARQHLHQRAALHRPHQCRPAPCERALVIWHAGVEVPRRPAERYRQTHAPPRAPVVHAFRRQRADDGDEDPA